MQLDTVLSTVVLQSVLLATTSACILLAADERHRKLAWIWVVSNALTAVSLYSYPANQPDAPTLVNAINSSLAILAAFIKWCCLSADAQRFWRRRRSEMIIAVGIAMIVIVQICTTPFRLLLLCVLGMALAASVVYAVERNRAWRGLQAKKLMSATFGVSFLMLAVRLRGAYPFGDQSAFVGTAREQMLALVLFSAITVFMQFGFLGLMTGRMERLRQRAQRRTASIGSRYRTLQEFNQQLARSGHERLVLLQLLTHEVRQPLNNAQAAIQAVLAEISSISGQREDGRLHGLIGRAQTIIDSITLSLSNAVVGTSLIERKQSDVRHATDLHELAWLATRDCPTSLLHRIRIAAPADPIFVTVDPNLMRLAFRNLLDNAIKYSPAQSTVDAAVGVCEERNGAFFTVENETLSSLPLKDDIFALKVRGSGEVGEGQGIGLYIVSQVARIHHGTVSFGQSAEGRVRFEIFVPY